VDLRGAGRTVVERIGLMPECQKVTLSQRGIAMVAADGRFLATMPVDAFDGEGIISEIEILRGDMSNVLLEASMPNVDHRFGDRITELTQDDQGVDVVLASGGRERYDLLIGADGVSSGVRRLIFGESGFTPFGLVTSWFTVPDPGDLDDWYLMFNAPGGRTASIRPGRVAGEAKAALSARVAAGERLPRDAAGRQAFWDARFAGVGWRVPRLLEQMGSADDVAFSPVGQVKLPRWSRGRVTLIGDAAACPSPLTGLGTSVALVQAYVLAGELAARTRWDAKDLAEAMERYEQICRPYVTQAQELPPGGVGGYAPRTATMIRLRTLSMAMMSRWPMRPILQRQFDKAGDIDLPSYPNLHATS